MIGNRWRPGVPAGLMNCEGGPPGWARTQRVKTLPTSTATSLIRRHPLVCFFVIAYAFSWSFEIPIVLAVHGVITDAVPRWIHYLASFGPLVGAVVVTAVTAGGQGVRQLMNRLLRWRVECWYYGFAIGVPMLLFGVALLLGRLLAGARPDLVLLGQPAYLPYLGPFGTLGLWFVTHGLGEEMGWRGFALPHLQTRQAATTSTLVLAGMWALWHLPAFFYRDTYIDMGLVGFPMFAISLLFAAMVFTWLYNSTGGSILLVVIFHAIFNWLSVSEAGGPFAPMIMTIPIVVWAVLIPRIYGPANASPLRKQTA